MSPDAIMDEDIDYQLGLVLNKSIKTDSSCISVCGHLWEGFGIWVYCNKKHQLVTNENLGEFKKFLQKSPSVTPAGIEPASAV